MKLGVQTHFSQGWSINLLQEAIDLRSDAVRDSIRWGETEVAKGVYDFSNPSAAWLTTALGAGAHVTLVFPGNGNALYDDGYSVNTDEGRAGFANFIVATLERFPDVAAIEIGNEYVGQNFVNGPIASQSLGQRDEAYAKMLDAVDRALDQAGIDVPIIGGAAHSIPVDWFTDLKNDGAFADMDAVAIHPYTTAPEQFENQIAVLRQAMGDTPLPIEVTEFGRNFEELSDAPPYLAKMVSVMAAAGIDNASWYALAQQSQTSNMELYDPASSQATPAGQTFQFMQQLLAMGEVEKVAIDDFTYFYSFGDRAAVVWGDPREIALGGDVSAYDLSGNPIADFSGRIGPDTPIVLISDNPITVGEDVTFGASATVGDSFDQFDVTNPVAGSTDGFEGAWSYFAQQDSNGRLTALQTMGGGLRNGESWTPYLGLTWLRPFFVSSTALSPVHFGDARYSAVERFTSDITQTVSIHGHWDVSNSSGDGITVTIRQNGATIFDQVVFDPDNGNVLDLDLHGIALHAGDTLDFLVGAHGSASGSDNTSRSITITADNPGEPGDQIADVVPPAEVRYHEITAHSSATSGTGEADRIDGFALSVSQRMGGGDGDDCIIGGRGNDKINGASGADWMAGGDGNDRYTVDQSGDVVSENPGEGQDSVLASVSYVLATNVEDLTLTGGDAIDATGNDLANGLAGNEGDNHLIGLAGNDDITGGAGSDYLVGGAGQDTLAGGPGTDVFVLDVLEDAASKTTIKDFEVGVDHIAIARDAFAAFAGAAAGALDPGLLAIGTEAATAGQHLVYNPRAGALYYDADGAGGEAQVQIARLWSDPHLDTGSFILV